MIWDHIIQNGTVVTPDTCYPANIYVKDGKIAAVTQEELPGTAVETSDATGKYVLPGFIDEHVHSRDGRLGPHYKEDFFHSSMAGAIGGVTTIFEMPNCNPAVYCVENLNDLIECITPKAHTDFGVWGLCLGDLNLDQIFPLSEAGVIGFKLFWGYAVDSRNYQLIYNYEKSMQNVIPPLNDGEIYRIFRQVARTGKTLGIHAENFYLINTLIEEIRATGADDYAALLNSRPPVSEKMVITTAIHFARELGTKIRIMHLSNGGSVDLIRQARREHLPVSAEACPHYLFLSDEDFDRCGSLMKSYPLVRTKQDQEMLWEGIRDGTISAVSSDHAPHTYEEKLLDMWTSPAGVTNIETMGALMLTAVNRGWLRINDIVRLMSENPAKTFGLYPQKGSIRIGADADVLLVDLNREYTIDHEKLHSRVKRSPYHGMNVKGWVEKTILRGKTVAEDGEITGEPNGQFVKPPA
jgi:allantoinase